MAIQSRVKKQVEVRQFVTESEGYRIDFGNTTFADGGEILNIENGGIFAEGSGKVADFQIYGEKSADNDSRRLYVNIELKHAQAIKELFDGLKGIKNSEYVDVEEFDYEVRERKAREAMEAAMLAEEQRRREEEERIANEIEEEKRRQEEAKMKNWLEENGLTDGTDGETSDVVEPFPWPAPEDVPTDEPVEETTPEEDELAKKEQEKAEQETGSDCGKIEDLVPGDETKEPVEDETPVEDPVEEPKKQEGDETCGKIEDLVPGEEEKK